jgi:hypothetical protein
MSLLNFSNFKDKAPRNSKNLKTILGIGALAGVIALGSTLAASINLNSGTPVEFGQGLTQTTACDNDIMLTPFSTFVNSQSGGTFMGTSILISNVDSSTEGCAGKSLTISSYSETSPTPIAQIVVAVTSTSPWFAIPEINGVTLIEVSESSFTITIDPGIIPIEVADVFKFTIESADLAESAPVSYEVGDTGPGGGTVFYVDISSQGFSETGAACSPSCRYLEAAPTNPALLNYWTDEEYPWSGNTSESVGTTDESFGTGWMNTSQSINQPNGGDAVGNAVTVAHAYRGPHGMADWFLPSKVELTQMCKWQGGEDWVSNETPCTGGTLNSGIGATGFMGHSSCGYFSSCYWSSSEAGSDAAWFQLFNSGDQAADYKTYLNHVRPIRAF